MRWAGTPEAQRPISDPSLIAEATHDDLICLLTTIIRGERFSDGEIAGAYERGTPRISMRLTSLTAHARGAGDQCRSDDSAPTSTAP